MDSLHALLSDDATEGPERDATPARRQLSAPRIGRFTPSVRRGQLIEPGQPIGALRVLTRCFEVLAPDDAVGRVTRLDAGERDTPVAYGAPLLTLEPIDGVGAARALDADQEADLPSGAVRLRAPMDGQFYCRPSPDEPAFFTPGQVVSPGDTLGLIEVMKFFYPFHYEGARPMTLWRVDVDDAAPVAGGDPLFVLVPVEGG